MNFKNLKYSLVAAVIFFTIFLALGELITRVLGATVVYQYDATLGWRPQKNLSKRIPVLDQSGEKYFVDYSANEFGFREFGDLHSGKKRILFVGDSWTGDPYTSDGEAYFGIVKNSLPVEVFAIGAGGYGTLQELMLVREFAEKIKPDILVLQYCDNDITNNSFFLEGPSITRNQKNLRPYRVDNRIKYRLPPNSPYVFLYRHFRLFRTLDALLATTQYKIYKNYYPPRYQAYDWFAPTPAQSPELQVEIDAQRASALSVTRFLMSEFKRTLPSGTKLVPFTASSDDPEQLRIWQTLADEAGFLAYPSVSMRVEEAEKQGNIVRIFDGAHWNRLGNKIAGEELARIIREDFL